MLKISVIGAGRIAHAHANAFKFLTDAVLYGAYDTNHESLGAFCSHFECTPFVDDIDMIRKSDLIIVCTPNSSHFEYTSKALVLGRKVICEKPLTNKLSDGLVLKGLDESFGGGVGYVSFNYRHNKVIKLLMEDIKSGVIGKIDHIRLEFLKGSMLTKQYIGWREKGDLENSSGAMSDLGAHLLDLCHFFIGRDIDIGDIRFKLNTAVSSISGEAVNVDDNSYMYARTEGGEFIEIHTSKVEQYRPHGLYIEITGNLGRLLYQTKMKGTYIRRIGGTEEVVTLQSEPLISDPEGEIYGWSDSFLYQLMDVINCAGAVTGSIRDGLKVQSVISVLSQKYRRERLTKEKASLGNAEYAKELTSVGI